MALMAYARVSTEGQTLAAQVAQLKAAGAETISKEKVSGVRADRPQLRKALAALGPDDVFLVTRLDRLARSTRDLLNILDEIGNRVADGVHPPDCSTLESQREPGRFARSAIREI